MSPQKPLLLLEFLIRECGQKNCAVVDLCCGAGSGAIAALRMGLTAVAIDNDSGQEYTCKERLEQFVAQEASHCHFAHTLT